MPKPWNTLRDAAAWAMILASVATHSPASAGELKSNIDLAHAETRANVMTLMQECDGNKSWNIDNMTEAMCEMEYTDKQQNERLAQLDVEIAEWRENIAEWRESIAEWRENIAEWRENIAEWRENIAEWRENIAQLNESIARKKQILNSKIK